MKLIEPNNYHVIDEPLDPMEIIRQKSTSDVVDDDPFYICNISDIIQKHRIWQQHMPRVLPFYAVKSNCDPIVIKMLVSLGTGFDCASKGEIESVLRFGVSPDLIIYANPTKNISHINYAAEMNVRLMTVDSKHEIEKVSKHFPNARLVLRIRYDAECAQIPLGEKYGCNPDTEAPALIEFAKLLGSNMIGISFHVGSGCLDAPVYGYAIKAARKLFDFAETVGYDFRLLDIGGGFPGDTVADFQEIASVVNHSIDLHFPSPDVTIIAEPGRFYVESAFTLACQVHSIREIQQNDHLHRIMYFINDGVYGSFANWWYQKIVPSNKLAEPRTLKSTDEEQFMSVIWGPTCDSMDQLFENVSLPRLKIGDFIIFENMGAYTIACATSFNGFPAPNIHYYIQRKDLENLNGAKNSHECIVLSGP